MTPAKPVKEGLALLREPFPAEQVGKLPRVTCRDCSDAQSRVCGKHKKQTCQGCGNCITSQHIHLDYVGHAALTDRLLDADQNWSWEPMGVTAEGVPVVDRNGGLWIRLTVCGVTRLGYGDAQGKQGGNAVKEAIGDALRNAGMRFGAALDLWHKGDLHAEEQDETPFDTTPWEAKIAASTTTDELARVGQELKAETVPDSAATLLRAHYAERLNELAGVAA